MKKYGNRYTGLIAVAAAGALSLAPVSADQAGQTGQAGQTAQTRPQTPQTPTMTAVTVKASDITANPEKHYNKKVAVTAEVDEVLGLQTFTIDEEAAAAAGGPDLLVISPALTSPIPDGAKLTVTGTLKPFVEADIKRDYNWNWWADWKAEMTTQFKDRPVLLAESIKTEDGKELIKK